MNQTALHIDCMEYMRGLPDKVFDLAIVDPPYGIGASEMTLGKGKKRDLQKIKDGITKSQTKNILQNL